MTFFLKNAVFVMGLLMCGLHEAKAQNTLFRGMGKANAVAMERIGPFTISKVPNCKQRKCKAYLATQKRQELHFERTGTNPIYGVCQKTGGYPDTFYDEKNNEISVCIFRDQSVIFAWDLMHTELNKSGD